MTGFVNEVEDEIHFLLKCPVLESTRSQFLNSIFESQPNFFYYTPAQQINYLYFNEHLPNNILDVANNMLSKMFEHRKKLISIEEDLWHCESQGPLVLKFKEGGYRSY